MHINPRTLCLDNVRFIPSPNCDARPDNTDISLIVIHAISLPPGEFGGGDVENLFTNRLCAGDHPTYTDIENQQVSAHLFIRRNGELIQFVPFDRRAWHAGVSSYEGRTQCNDFSIGIELEGCDTKPFETVQYQKLCAVCHALIAHYPAITDKRITTHAAIAPDRKTDPGPHFECDFLSRYA